MMNNKEAPSIVKMLTILCLLGIVGSCSQKTEKSTSSNVEKASINNLNVTKTSDNGNMQKSLTKPDTRSYSVSWADGNGNLWLFGGMTGYVSNYQDAGKSWSTRELNDLW